MDKLLKEALSYYSFENPEIIYLRHNENITYKIKDNEKNYVLRIHKPVDGFSLGILSNEGNMQKFIQSEMVLLEYLHKNAELEIQKPVRNKNLQLVSVLGDSTPVTVLEWIQGVTLSDTEITFETAEKIGSTAAHLHLAAKNMKIAEEGYLILEGINGKINRYQYRQQILKKITDELKIAESKGHIDSRYINIILNAVEKIKKRMDELCKTPGTMGFIHADLSMSNMILTADNGIAPIDFSLSGVGFYYMDIGMMLSAFNDKNIRRCIKNGYEKEMKTKIPMRYIEAFFAFGVILFIACQHNKVYMEEWFYKAMERWCNTIFTPLINDETFVL